MAHAQRVTHTEHTEGQSTQRVRSRIKKTEHTEGQVANQENAQRVKKRTEGQVENAQRVANQEKITRNRSVLSIAPNNDWRYCSQEQRIIIMDLTLIMCSRTKNHYYGPDPNYVFKNKESLLWT